MQIWHRKTKDYKIGLCLCSAKHTVLNSKGKDWLAQNQNNMSELSEMSTRCGIHVGTLSGFAGLPI
jgi:hypothetical protein